MAPRYGNCHTRPVRRYAGLTSAPALGAPIKSTFTALDSRTNKIVWQKEDKFGQSYGALSTAGGLVFRGQVDGNLVAYDARRRSVVEFPDWSTNQRPADDLG